MNKLTIKLSYKQAIALGGMLYYLSGDDSALMVKAQRYLQRRGVDSENDLQSVYELCRKFIDKRDYNTPYSIALRKVGRAIRKLHKQGKEKEAYALAKSFNKKHKHTV